MTDKIKSLVFTLPISAVYYCILGIILYYCKLSWDFSYTHTWFALITLVLPVIFIVFGYIFYDDYEDVFTGLNITAVVAVGLIVILGIADLIGGEMLRADRYFNIANQRVTIVEAENANDVFPALINDGDTSKVPLYSEEEAYKKAKAELAKTSLESQISVNDSFMTQDVNGDLVYVGTTYPRSVFKRNAENQYYMINRNTGETTSFSAKDFKYMNDKYFGDNAIRYLRNTNDGHISDVNLEIDDNGKPYYVASVLDREFFGGYDIVTGIIIMDPTNGKTTYYGMDEIPSWVDRVYPENVLMDYISYYGKYGKGFTNSLFKQEGVINPTSTTATTSYEVIYIDGEAYLWTGMVSANASGSSDANGIMLASLKTGEITYYKTSGVSESHAMNISEGLVQEKGYRAGYPIPLKVNGIPSMFMIMRDDNNNIVGYSLVSYTDYTKSAYSDNLNELITKYLSVVGKSSAIDQVSDAEMKTVTGTISDIATEVVDGRTMYYIEVEGQIYSLTSQLNVDIVFAKTGDTVEVTFVPSDSQVIPVNKIKFSE